MTFVYEDPAITGPATHVLIIGAGHYPHLPGGGGSSTPHDNAMRQLSSPPLSARLVANWFIKTFDNPDQPLASVDLLLAEPDAAQHYTPPVRTIGAAAIAPQQQAIERAELAAIGAAAARWKERGNAAPGSLLVFYFCGHGIAVGTDYALVAADYGSQPPGKPYHGLVHFTEFLGGMADCATTRQIFFVDACRSAADTLFVHQKLKADELLQSEEEPTRGLQQCVYYSTLGGEGAHALPNQPSLFTRALVDALDGSAAANTFGRWRINTLRLLEAIDYFMQLHRLDGAEMVQVPQSGSQTSYDIHYLSGNPRVQVRVPVDNHEGKHPPAGLTSLTLSRNATPLACYPPSAPPAPSPLVWERRHFVSWLETGPLAVAAVKTNGAVNDEHYVQTPGFTVPGL